MYPRLSDLFSDYLGFNLPIPINSFGFMVALGAMTGAWILQKELDRMYSIGQVGSVRIPDPEKGKKGRTKYVDVSPSFLVGTLTIIIIVAGFFGARVFHILENLDSFFRSPSRMIFTTGGFTFYGGMILGGFAVVYYIRKKGLNLGRTADAFAPGVIISYGIGRLGCQLAGDGDWGIASDLAAKPEWLPMWLWAETYPNNIMGIDLSMTPVYPTPLYEFAAAIVIFMILWAFRNHAHRAGWLFWVYVVFNGSERFFIEKIRVNNRFDIFGQTITQAELIALALILVGVIGIWKTWKPIKKEDGSTSE
ncbi:MAG: prolipoprotein diacylglyceryl transferase [Bacteroidetes Order II. Incertae sedis bacterium]|jgi:phosphatidylglycerol---prolipoprotein diacylglyceryl transferase|nr:prolipoprotein diacylglyceryl transferase [Bacteroidetes Order II. bacterium]MDG1754050.1 prolipoprotein diacylglyceryl transferase [Rhodothermales bacterium]HAY36957.1 diacylglyceryl transferase [Bacteroidota bacterium]MBT4052131.1 prolipoprotein diacylglyceryl transferase [Bacteroidetes Order II. bacterium]MBT5250143.1 prolipoprotein diacylglyceryl transferase [Bacteroidetes Order II. bacterium]